MSTVSISETVHGMFSTAPMSEVVDQAMLEKSFRKYEKIGNFCGYLPVVSSITGGIIRSLLGMAQAVSFFVASVFKGIGSLFVKDASVKEQMRKDAYICLIYAGHGIANMVRGAIEAAWPVSLLLLIYDFAGFRLRYPTESNEIYQIAQRVQDTLVGQLPFDPTTGVAGAAFNMVAGTATPPPGYMSPQQGYMTPPPGYVSPPPVYTSPTGSNDQLVN